MALITLGRLELAGQNFPQRQALLLLAYLNLEGRKERSYLAELFWPDAKRPLNNLSSAMTRIRSVDQALISGDRYTVTSAVASDAERFLEHAGAGRFEEALDLYQGRFLDGFPLNRLGMELQEWILDRRADLAGTGRDCARQVAVALARQGRTEAALVAAERSFELGRDAIPDPEGLAALHAILAPAGHPLAARVRAEAAEFGVDLGGSDGEPDRPATDVSTATAATVPADDADPAADRTGSAATIDRPFFGRQAELEDLERGLERDQVVAITGLGGIGKSRLAAALLDRIGDRRGPTHWIDAAGVGSAELLPEVISLSVFPEQEPAITVDQLVAALGDRRLIITLDGVDRLAGRLSLLEPVPAGCPNLGLVVTSRSEVDLPAGTRLRLTGLPSAADGSQTAPALQLFQAWFQRRAPMGATLDLEDPAPIEICERLQGLPLAIELAAAWLTVLTPREIADELASGEIESALLQDLERSMAPHHPSLDTVMAGTWELLDEQCRLAAAGLSVFPSGFDRKAAEAVSQCDVMTLRRLAAWSIVTRTDGAHYRCHPLVRSYARERLAADADLEYQSRWAHARYLLSAVSEAPMVEAFEDEDALDTVEDPVTNLLTAWRLLVEEMDVDELANLADPLDRVLSRFGRYRTLLEELEHTTERIQAAGGPTSILDRLAMHQAWLHLRLGDYGRSRALTDRLLDRGDDERPVELGPDIRCEAVRAAAAIDRTDGDVDRALERLLEVRPVADLVSPRMRALIDDDIGLCQMVLGLYPESRQSYGSVLAWARGVGSQPMIARTLLSLGTGHHDAGEPLDSLGYLLEAKSVVVVNRLTHLEPNVDTKLARAHLAGGDITSARQIIEGAQQRGGTNLEPWLVVEFDLLEARLAGAEDRPGPMWDHLERALTSSADLGDVPFMAKTYVALIELGLARPEIGDLSGGGQDLLTAVAAEDSGADHADRIQALTLLERADPASRATEPKPIVDAAADAHGYLRRARVVTRTGPA